jgi:pantoate--beta-alanine ligase
MRIIRAATDMQEIALALRAQGSRIGLVPTMGFLHEGHASLMRLARPHCDTLVVSIFVNPTQFGPSEDLAAYPRDMVRDQDLCEKAGVDLIFAPEAVDIYPSNYSTYIHEELLSRGLCGVSRPGHFRGVCTVVAKLYNLCLPHVAVFGEKDAQQLRVLRRMTRDLAFPVEIIPGPIVRDADGLAMSSRNKYLSLNERAEATVLRRSLDFALNRVAQGERDGARLVADVRQFIEQSPAARIDYVELADDDSLEPVVQLKGPAVLALAVFFGRARLLDNVRLIP